MRAALLATVLTAIPLASAQAQDCRAAIERADRALSASADFAADEGPARQEGDAAEIQPQEGDPGEDVDAGTSGPSGREGEANTQHPQLGDPTERPGEDVSGGEHGPESASSDGERQGPARQEGDEAENQPQHGEPDRVPSDQANGNREGDSSDAVSIDESAAPLRIREGGAEEVRALRDEAARHLAAGDQGRCLELMDQAVDLMETEANR